MASATRGTPLAAAEASAAATAAEHLGVDPVAAPTLRRSPRFLSFAGGRQEAGKRKELKSAGAATKHRPSVLRTDDAAGATLRGAKRVKTASISVVKAAPTSAVLHESKEDYVVPPFDYGEAIAHISKAHEGRLAHLTSTVECEPFICVPRLPAAANIDPAFRSLCRSIIFQQISGKAAQSIMNRFVDAFRRPGAAESGGGDDAGRTANVTELWSTAKDPEFFPSPKLIYSAPDELLRTCGLSGRKVMYVKDLASRFANGDLSIERLMKLSDEDVSKALLPIKGIGQWTVDMFLIFTLRRPDILPLTDLGIQKGFVKLFGGKGSTYSFGRKVISPDEMSRLAEPFRPYRSLAVWYIWHILQ